MFMGESRTLCFGKPSFGKPSLGKPKCRTLNRRRPPQGWALASFRSMVLFALTLLGIAAFSPLTATAQVAEDGKMMATASPSMGMTHFAPYSVPETHMVRVALLNTGDGLAGALQLNILLSRYRRQDLEERMGLKLEVVNISNARADHIEHTVLYYRPGFLRPALVLAEVIPGEQAVEPMSPRIEAKKTVDIQILVGKELP